MSGTITTKKPMIPAIKVNIAINWDVDNIPIFPLLSFLKNSTANLPTLYNIRYSMEVLPRIGLLDAYHNNTAIISKSPNAINNWVGSTFTPLGAKSEFVNTTPSQESVSLP